MSAEPNPDFRWPGQGRIDELERDLATARDRIAALEAERDHWHSAAAKRREALEECAAYFKAQKCKGAPYLLVAEALTPEEKP
jgi:hypothetical protein